MRASLLCLLGVACRPAGLEDEPPAAAEADADTDADADADADADTDIDSAMLTGEVDGSGFGAALALVDSTLYIGAPHGEIGQVFRYQGQTLAVAVEGEGRLGSALAGGTELLIGAPLQQGGAGALLDSSGQPLTAGVGGTGLAVAWGEDWLVAHGSGWQSATDKGDTVERPSAIAALWDGSSWQVGVGMFRGAVALQVGEQTRARIEEHDEAGLTLAAGDVDGDGSQEWILGAPGAGRVEILSADLSVEATLTGSGRFGASLAVADVDGDGIDDLLIGSPMAGDQLEGAATLYTGGNLKTPAVTFAGEDEGDLLGFAVALHEGAIALGAPGGAEMPGRVELHVTW